MVVDDVERRIDDGRGKAGAAGVPHVAVVQMQPARAKDLGREVELLFPVVDDRASEETLRPLVHLARHLFGNLHEHGIAMDGQLEVALVVQRHGRDLAQRVLAVEHPAVGARQQRVGDVADAVFDRRIRLRRGTGALNPLALEVLGNLAADESRRRGRLEP